MKKFISVFLVISIIISNLNLNLNSVEALSNTVKSLYSISSQSESENKSDPKDKQSETENKSDPKDKQSETENKSDPKDKQSETENKSDPKNKLFNDTELKESNTSKTKDKDLKNTQAITVSEGTISKNYDTLSKALDAIDSANSRGTATIRFNKNYEINSNDLEKFKHDFRNERLIFTANTGVTVTVTGDLKLHYDNRNYQPTYDKANVITFENIKLNFTGNHTIYTNGLWLHVGKNVEMVGNYYPRIVMGTDESGGDITDHVRIFIESGEYSKILAHSELNGRTVDAYKEIYWFGGHTKEIVTKENDRDRGSTVLKAFGGEIDKYTESKIGTGFAKSNLQVGGKVTIKQIDQIDSVEIGIYEYVNSDYKLFEGELIITESMNIGSSLGMEENCILEIGKDVPTIKLGTAWFGNNCTIRIPGNRNKTNIPLILDWGVTMYNPINLELSTNINMDNFYLMKVNNDSNLGQNFYKISEDQYFYLEDIEEEFDSSTGRKIGYLKAKAKEKGPLIYDVDKNEFSYIDRNNREQSAWWIKDKITTGKLNLNNTLNYDDLVKQDYYYVFSPDPVEFKIRGSGSGRTLKFENDRHSDRKFNIKFENLNATDSEFSFENVNSIILDGSNSITQNVNNKTALTYSFTTGSTANTLSLATDDSNFVVYNKDTNNKYDIRNNIVNKGNRGNTSIVNMSVEDNLSTIRNLQLYPMGHGGGVKKFSTKPGCDKMTVLLPGDNKDYILTDENNTAADSAYYYQSAGPASGQNSGPIGTKFTLTPNSTENYYQVNNRPRVHVIATQSNNKFYYLEDTLKSAMDSKVDHTGGTHEVVFLGNYNITQDDVNSIKSHNKKTSGITFKTKVDDLKYVLNVGEDIELKKDDNGNGYPVKFDEIKFNYTASDKWIYANGRQLTFGSDVEMQGPHYPSISAGQTSGATAKVNNAEVTINSGTYDKVTGDRNNTVQSANVTINGGIFNGIVDAGNSTTSNLNLTINGGTFNNEVIAVNGGTADSATLTIANGAFKQKVSGTTSGSTLSGSLNIQIDGGTFNGEVIGVNGGTVNSATLRITNGTFTSKVSGIKSGSISTGSLNMQVDGGTFNSEVIGVNGGTSNSARLTITDGIFNKSVSGITSGSILNGDLNMQIDGGTFYKLVAGACRKNTTSNTINLTGTLNISINGGTFKDQVQGINSGLDNGTVNLNISRGTFESNVGGIDQFSNGGTATITINGGEYRGILFGEYSTSASNTAKSVTLNINGGDFKGMVYGDCYSENTTINISGGNFVSLKGSDSKRGNTGATINIKGNVTIPTIYNYDKLVVGAGSNPVVLTITGKTDEDDVNFESELAIKNASEVRLQSNNQSKVDKLTLEGDLNKLTLNMNTTTAPLIVKSDYNHNSKKLILKPLGTKVPNSELIEFLRVKADANNFKFDDPDYYIREIDKGTGNKIVLFEKMSPASLTFKLDASNLNLQYSTDGTTFEDVWWYTFNNSGNDIEFLEDNLLKYKGMGLFKDANNITYGNKVFEITNSQSDKNISIDLGQGKNFDLKLNNAKLTNSTVDAKNLRNLILSGSNSIYGNLSENKPAFSYGISGEVQTSNDSSNLVVYTGKSKKGIEATSKSGYGFEFVLEEPLQQPKTIHLKEKGTTNTSVVGLDMKPNYEKVGLLLPKSFKDKTYNLTDDVSNSNRVYYSGSVVNKTFGYDILITNPAKTYNNVSNKPFIAISENGSFKAKKHTMREVEDYIRNIANKENINYTLTFMHGYIMNTTDLTAWESCKEKVKSMTLTTKYDPLTILYTLTVDGNLNLPGLDYQTTFKDIKLKFNNNDPYIYANGQSLVMGSGVEVIGNNKLSLSGGSSNSSTTIDNADIKVLSGTYKSIIGSTSPVRGKVLVKIGGTTEVSDLISGSDKSVVGNLTIALDKDITVNEISNFGKLIVGNTTKVTLSGFSKLDKGSSKGDLELKNGSKVLFTTTGVQTSKLRDIIIDGADNTFVLPPNLTEQSVLVELSGNIKGGKLNIELNSKPNNNANGTYLIKFTTPGNSDVENKYTLPKGYYVRDKQNNGSGYAILYPQTTFDLKYNFNDNKLYMIENGIESEAWWYTSTSSIVNLTTDDLYKYKGYDLFLDPNNSVDRNLTLTGSNNNQTFNFKSTLNNVNVILDNINLTDSELKLDNLKHLKLKGENTIKSLNKKNTIFTYSFNNHGTGDKVSTENNKSHLKIFTNKTTAPFSGSSALGIDFKFFKDFEKDSYVRLSESNGNNELGFTIPKDTGRLGILLGSANKNKTYNLYHGKTGNTGTSVYVSGNTDATFKESFETSSNSSIKTYDYVRRANPVNRVNINVTKQMDFNIDTQSSGLGGIRPDNWQKYFNATDMNVENNSLIVKDQFIDENGKVHNFGQTSTDLELGYLGVYSSNNTKNDIELVDKNTLDPNITNIPSGAKVALKFSDGTNEVSIDENSPMSSTPSKIWTIPSSTTKTLEVQPDFDSNNHFFNVNMYAPSTIVSNHRFKFRFELKMP